jgi:hypothetical protein
MSSNPPEAERERLLQRAAEDVLVPLARLCVGHGLPFGRAEELFKRAYVRAAREARRKAGTPAKRDVSQVAVTTGMNRRDVARITAELTPRAVQRASPATQVMTEWLSNLAYRHANGRIRRLPRQGEAPSFEALAASVTRHVHARSLLDELVRLGHAHVDEASDQVVLQRDRVVPRADQERMYGFLGANVGDHLAAATDNVLSGESRHLEQALFSNELSAVAIGEARDLVRRQWRSLLADLVPALEALIAADRAAGRPPGHRLRVGLYGFDEPLTDAQPDVSPPPTPDAAHEPAPHCPDPTPEAG